MKVSSNSGQVSVSLFFSPFPSTPLHPEVIPSKHFGKILPRSLYSVLYPGREIKYSFTSGQQFTVVSLPNGHTTFLRK